MATSPARRLILFYAALLALLDLSVLLPGNPHSTFWGFIGGVVVQMLLVWRLWHGSLAWFLAFALAVLTVVSIVLTAAEAETGVILLLVFSLGQAVILCTPPITAFVWGRPKTPLVSD
jgi:hypothetical protein